MGASSSRSTSMLAAETLDLDAARDALRTMISADDPRFARLDDSLRRAMAEQAG